MNANKRSAAPPIRLAPTLALLCGSIVAGQVVPDGAPFQVNTYTTESQDRPNVASSSNGEFLVTWQSRGQDGGFEGIFARAYDSAAQALSGEVQVNSYTSSAQGSPKVLVGPQGIVATWRDGSFDGDGGSIMVKVPGQDEFLANTHTTGNHQKPDLAMDAQGDFVVVWENGDDQDGDGRGVFGQRFDAAGTVVGSEFQVNTTTTGSQDGPAVDGVADGRFVVVWNAPVGGDAQVMAQRFASDGSKVGAEITVNTPSYDRNDPDVAMAEDGSFVVVWKSHVDPTYEVYSRRFDANGVPTTASLPLASTVGFGGYRPSIRRHPGGDYVVLWNDGLGDLNMRQLGADGVAQDNRVVVAQGFEGEIAFTPDGELGLVTWTEIDTDGDSLGVFARRVAEALFASGFESGDTTEWSLTSP